MNGAVILEISRVLFSYLPAFSSAEPHSSQFIAYRPRHAPQRLVAYYPTYRASNFISISMPNATAARWQCRTLFSSRMSRKAIATVGHKYIHAPALLIFSRYSFSRLAQPPTNRYRFVSSMTAKESPVQDAPALRNVLAKSRSPYVSVAVGYPARAASAHTSVRCEVMPGTLWHGRCGGRRPLSWLRSTTSFFS